MEILEKRRVNVRALIWHEGKLLAVKHKSEHGGEANYWCVPGGGLDPMESLEDGLRREILEETGVKAQIGRLVLIQQFPSERKHRDEELEFFFVVENGADFTAIDLSKTSHGLEELSRIEFIDPSKEYILPKVLSTPELIAAMKSEQPVIIYNEL